MKLGKEIMLCDLTNTAIVKIMYFLVNNEKQTQPIHFEWCMYVHVTDREKDCEDET